MNVIAKSEQVFQAERNGQKFEGYFYALDEIGTTGILMTMEEIEALDWLYCELNEEERYNAAKEMSSIWLGDSKEKYWLERLTKRVRYPETDAACLIVNAFLTVTYLHKNNIQPKKSQHRVSNYIDCTGLSVEETLKRTMEHSKQLEQATGKKNIIEFAC